MILFPQCQNEPITRAWITDLRQSTGSHHSNKRIFVVMERKHEHVGDPGVPGLSQSLHQLLTHQRSRLLGWVGWSEPHDEVSNAR